MQNLNTGVYTKYSIDSQKENVLITRITLRVISGYVTLYYIIIKNLYLLTCGLKMGSS